MARTMLPKSQQVLACCSATPRPLVCLIICLAQCTEKHLPLAITPNHKNGHELTSRTSLWKSLSLTPVMHTMREACRPRHTSDRRVCLCVLAKLRNVFLELKDVAASGSARFAGAEPSLELQPRLVENEGITAALRSTVGLR